MDSIRLAAEITDTPAGGPIEIASIHVNGRSLVQLAREVELPFAERAGAPDRAGSYIGLPAEAVFLPSRRLLGEGQEGYDDRDGRISVLGCPCGVVGCWPLQARITTRDDVVMWDDFVQPHRRGWNLSRMGTFVFDRNGYEAALQEIPG